MVLLITLLAACAGDKKSSDKPDSSDSSGNAAANNSSADGAGAQAAQVTEEPLAARVNGQPITLANFQRERDRSAAGMSVQPATQSTFDAQILQTMIDQVLIEQAAASQGIVVTDAEVDTELAAQSDLAAANGQKLEDVIASQMYTMPEYREVIRGMLLTQKVSQVAANVSPNAPQVHARHILVADEATARDLIARLQQGEDFAQLAMQYSLDTSTSASGGDLDWVSQGVLLQTEVEQAIFALQPGQLDPEPVKSSLGYHVIQVLERVEDRPLSQAALAEKRQQAFMAWLDSQRQNAVIERYVGVAN
jgi:parvulin-like peptidyl-prolyl isomerase